MIDVEHRSLGSLEHDGLSVGKSAVEESCRAHGEMFRLQIQLRIYHLSHPHQSEGRKADQD